MTLSQNNRMVHINLPIPLIDAVKLYSQNEGFTFTSFCRKAIMARAEEVGAFNVIEENNSGIVDNSPCYNSIEEGLKANPLLSRDKPKPTTLGIYCASVKMRVRKGKGIISVAVYTPALPSKKAAQNWRTILIDTNPEIFHGRGCYEFLLIKPDFSDFA